jgi:hypothetical protein
MQTVARPADGTTEIGLYAIAAALRAAAVPLIAIADVMAAAAAYPDWAAIDAELARLGLLP